MMASIHIIRAKILRTIVRYKALLRSGFLIKDMSFLEGQTFDLPLSKEYRHDD